MSKRIEPVTYERRCVIIEGPDDWTPADPLPVRSEQDQWFDTFSTFVAALGTTTGVRSVASQSLEAVEGAARPLGLNGTVQPG